MNVVWYPEIALEKWLKLHPSFKEDLPLECLCGEEIYNVTPYVTANSVGISTGLCACGVKSATTISKPRSPKLTAELRQLLADLAR